MTKAPHPSELVAPMDYEAMAPRSLTQPHPVNALPGAVSYLNIAYATVIGWRPLLLDLHLPAAGPGPYPVVVYAHGGGWPGGIKAMGPWHSLPARGIAVASVAYRLSGEARFPDPVEDLRAAIRWVRAHAQQYLLDADRVAGWGSSAGAFLMALAGVLGDEPLGRPVGTHEEVSAGLSAVVDHYGVADPSRLREDAYDNSEQEMDAFDGVVRQFLGFDPRDPGSAEPSLDPLAVAARRGAGPPFLIMHGDRDRRVGLGQSRRLHDGLTALGISSQLTVIPGADHGAPQFFAPDTVETVTAFLHRTWRAVDPR